MIDAEVIETQYGLSAVPAALELLSDFVDRERHLAGRKADRQTLILFVAPDAADSGENAFAEERANRLRLLTEVRRAMDQVADFSLVSG